MPRPLQTWNNFIGQRRVVKYTNRIIDGALRKDVPLYFLIHGDTGMGKTHLAKAISKKLQTQTTTTIAKRRMNAEHFKEKIFTLSPHDLLHIDEAQDVPDEIWAIFKEIYDLQTLDEKELPVFHLVLSTWQIQKIPGDVIGRCTELGLNQAYTQPELRKIVEFISDKYRLNFSSQVVSLFVQVSLGYPRKIEELLKNFSLWRNGNSQVNVDEAREYLKERNISPQGYTIGMLNYLFAFGESEATLTQIAAWSNTNRTEILRTIEPFLIREGNITIISNGKRKITPKGQESLIEMQKYFVEEE